jgi:hypothetical protein
MNRVPVEVARNTRSATGRTLEPGGSEGRGIGRGPEFSHQLPNAHPGSIGDSGGGPTIARSGAPGERDPAGILRRDPRERGDPVSLISSG